MRLCNKKTGEHGEYQVIIAGNLIRVRDCDSEDTWQYDSLAAFCEKWEDYTPKEHLIKDEKIRKAVRAWAEANSIKEIIIFDCGNNAPYTPVGAVDFAENGSHLEIRFRTEERFDTDRIYAIDELCWSEE